MGVDLDLGWLGNIGQGRRSKVKAKCPKSCFDLTVTLLYGQGQRSESRSQVKVKGQGRISGVQWSILGARLCQVQQGAKENDYLSKMFLCVLTNRADAVDRLLILDVFVDKNLGRLACMSCRQLFS